MDNRKKLAGLVIASAAALAFAVVPAASTLAASSHGKVPCMGVNSCKGKGACKSGDNKCKGKNACKGKGAKLMSAKRCAKKGGTVMESSSKQTQSMDSNSTPNQTQN